MLPVVPAQVPDRFARAYFDPMAIIAPARTHAATTAGSSSAGALSGIGNGAGTGAEAVDEAAVAAGFGQSTRVAVPKAARHGPSAGALEGASPGASGNTTAEGREAAWFFGSAACGGWIQSAHAYKALVYSQD